MKGNLWNMKISAVRADLPGVIYTYMDVEALRKNLIIISLMKGYL